MGDHLSQVLRGEEEEEEEEEEGKMGDEMAMVYQEKIINFNFLNKIGLGKM